ncbi:MAG TPA: hypothetical protein VFQ53_23935 [Kofleriaceae bacterium]|nr:hypothetical protein [Kofleriaceae bacterium]
MRGLYVLAAIAGLLAIVVALDLRRAGPPSDRALVSGFSADAVTALAWDGTRVVRDPASATGWSIAGTRRTPAEARTVEAVLSALRGARWQRREAAAVAGTPSRTLAIETAAGTTKLAFGDALPGGDGDAQQWLVAGDHALLVDAWVARALAPDPLALRVRTPFAAVLDATELRIEPGIMLRGSPRRLVDPTGHELFVAGALVDDLERALLATTIVAVAAPPAGEPIARITFDGGLVATVGPPCTGGKQRWVAGPLGEGCVDETAWQAVARAIAALARPAAEIIERRPVPLDRIAKLTLPDSGVLDLAKRPRIGSHDADPARALELAAILAAPGQPVPRPATKPTGQLAVTGDRIELVLELYGRGIVARRGEPLALQIGDGAYALLVRPQAAYRDPVLWLEEPTTIQRVTLDGKPYARGPVIGEWLRDAQPVADPAALDALVELLASPRAIGELPEPVTLPHAIELAIVPPVGPASKRALRIGKLPQGCAASVDASHVLVAPELCAAIERVR